MSDHVWWWQDLTVAQVRRLAEHLDQQHHVDATHNTIREATIRHHVLHHTGGPGNFPTGHNQPHQEPADLHRFHPDPIWQQT